MKNGKQFEDLVTWINQCLHNWAEIIPNSHMPDKDSGTKRQIDILIKLKDGPSEIIGIVEVRDRSRKVTIDYVEQVISKRNSVNADFAVIVSKSGFCKTALRKAKIANIRTFTYEEALKNSWSASFSNNFKFVSIVVKSEAPTIYFIDKSTNKIIDPSSEFINNIITNGVDSLVFYNKHKVLFKSVSQLTKELFMNDKLRESLSIGKENAITIKIFFEINLPDDDKIYLVNNNNEFVEINYLCIIGKMWLDTEEVNYSISQYKNEEQNYADVISTEINKQSVDILIDNPDDLSKDRHVKTRFNN